MQSNQSGIRKLKRQWPQIRHTGFVLVNLYLIGFMAGCSQRPSELPVSTARHIETWAFHDSQVDVMKAFITVLQDDHYTLDSADRELGIITASKHSEHPLTSLSTVTAPDSVNEMTGVQKFFLVAGLAIAVGAIFAIFSDDDDTDNDHHHGWNRQPHYTVVDHADEGRMVWEYRVTANFYESAGDGTQVRMSVQGVQRQGNAVQQIGPVQNATFYEEIFQKVDDLLRK